IFREKIKKLRIGKRGVFSRIFVFKNHFIHQNISAPFILTKKAPTRSGSLPNGRRCFSVRV
ncbi:MAG: hypothetical protein IJB44_04895, partial [Clostridia bacterium]|nr:hypothetical protein [Clostridia bacterium]